jgi:4-amino-4-deoxy-L-arabinose transferase-like glycosyltransferase
MRPWTGPRWKVATLLTLGLALLATVPTTGDLGLTWDEPAYRYSQLVSAQWWERLARARSLADLNALIEPDTLLYHWPYGRHGINFHPPLAGQLNLLTHEVFGGWLKDIPSRRLSSVIEFSVAITLLFGFLARRYGAWVGGVSAASLLLMPRVYAHGHIAGTDMPGLLLWGSTALAFWKGVYEPDGRRWRIAVGVLIGLAFVEKMAAVMVLAPLLAWLVVGHLPATLGGKAGRASWIDGLVTSLAMLLPLAIAFVEIRRLAELLPEPKFTNLFLHRPPSPLPGALLAVPLAVWITRRLLGRVFRSSSVWGVERPALETWTAILAFAPPIAWLGNPAWWRETFPRLAHYYLLNTDREGSLPDIRIMYFGDTYLYSLPWHNGWVLIALTVPVGILLMAAMGLAFSLVRSPNDRLPLFFLVHFATLPALRMLPTPAHDGVRLLLPSFFFLAGLAGWGLAGLSWLIAWPLRGRDRPRLPHVIAATLAVPVLGQAAIDLIRIHPFELSYYNHLIGGPAGAWNRGLELSYWYDAYDPRALRELNRRLPAGAVLMPPNAYEAVPTFQELQTLGELRGDLRLDADEPGRFPFMWLLTHDSKADPFSRLLFALRPWYARSPGQLGGLRVATVADPVAVSRAWALSLLSSGTSPPRSSPRAPLPSWLRDLAPFLARFWGEGLTLAEAPAINQAAFSWAIDDPDGLQAAAEALARGDTQTNQADRLRLLLTRKGRPEFEKALQLLLAARPDALPEAVSILITRPDAVRALLLRQPYTDPAHLGGDLDQHLEPHRAN